MHFYPHHPPISVLHYRPDHICFVDACLFSAYVFCYIICLCYMFYVLPSWQGPSIKSECFNLGFLVTYSHSDIIYLTIYGFVYSIETINHRSYRQMLPNDIKVISSSSFYDGQLLTSKTKTQHIVILQQLNMCVQWLILNYVHKHAGLVMIWFYPNVQTVSQKGS